MKVLLPGQAFQMKGNRVTDLSQHVITSGAFGHTSRQIGHIGRKVVRGFFRSQQQRLGSFAGSEVCGVNA